MCLAEGGVLFTFEGMDDDPLTPSPVRAAAAAFLAAFLLSVLMTDLLSSSSAAARPETRLISEDTRWLGKS